MFALINDHFFQLSYFLQLVANGLLNGALYAGTALTVVLVFLTTGHINFAQGEMATMSVFIVFVLSQEAGVPLGLAVILTIILSAVVGAVIERTVVRPVELREGHGMLIISLGLYLLLNALIAIIWGTVPLTAPKLFPAGLDDQFVLVEGKPRFVITYGAIGTWVLLAVVVTTLTLVLNKTKLGLGYRAVASNRESASLHGVQVGRMLMFGWGAAAGTGVLVGMLVAQKNGSLDFNLMGPILIYGFAAAALGGFDSIKGAVVGGLIVGLVESLVPGLFTFIGGELSLGIALAVMIAILIVRPEGLFGRRQVTRA